MSLIFNIIVAFIFNVFINSLYFNHIKILIDEENNKNLNAINKINSDINLEINGVKDSQKNIEKITKENDTSLKLLKKDKIVNDEIKKKNEELEVSFQTMEENFNLLKKDNIVNDEIKKKNEELKVSFQSMEENLNNIQIENKKIIDNVYEELKKENKNTAGNNSSTIINETRFLSKIKNTNFVNIDNNRINMNKIDTHVCTISIKLYKSNSIDIKEKIRYNYNKILNVSANVYNKENRNIIHIINPSDIKIIDNNCIIKNTNISIEDNYILCIYLHIICDKYSFNL